MEITLNEKYSNDVEFTPQTLVDIEHAFDWDNLGTDCIIADKILIADKPVAAIIVGYDRFIENEDGTVSDGPDAPRQFYIEVMPWGEDNLGDTAFTCYWLAEEDVIGNYNNAKVLMQQVYNDLRNYVEEWASNKPTVYIVEAVYSTDDGEGNADVEIFATEKAAKEYFDAMVHREKTDEEYSWVAQYFNDEVEGADLDIVDIDNYFSASNGWGNQITWSLTKRIVL